MLSAILVPLSLASLVLARTDLTGCTSSKAVSPAGASLIWYVPGTGELCEFLDCGGGRAPPKTTVPGCAAYSGTATYSPSYLPGYGPNGKDVASSTSMTPTGAAAGATASTTFDLSASNSGVTVLTGSSSPKSASVTSMPTATPVISRFTSSSGSSSSPPSGSAGSSSSSSSSTSSRNAAPTAWIANAGLIAGLGAVVAVL